VYYCSATRLRTKNTVDAPCPMAPLLNPKLGCLCCVSTSRPCSVTVTHSNQPNKPFAPESITPLLWQTLSTINHYHYTFQLKPSLVNKTIDSYHYSIPSIAHPQSLFACFTCFPGGGPLKHPLGNKLRPRFKFSLPSRPSSTCPILPSSRFTKELLSLPPATRTRLCPASNALRRTTNIS
jgi:hypothetical protein